MTLVVTNAEEPESQSFAYLFLSPIRFFSFCSFSMSKTNIDHCHDSWKGSRAEVPSQAIMSTILTLGSPTRSL